MEEEIKNEFDISPFVRLEAYAVLLDSLKSIQSITKMHILVRIACGVVRKFVKKIGDKLHAEVGLQIDPYARWDTPPGLTTEDFELCISYLKHYCESAR